MKKNNRAIILKGNNPLFFHCLDDVYTYYSSYKLLPHLFRKVLKKLGIKKFNRFMYGKWINELEGCDKVILFDGGFEKGILDFIRRKNPVIKIVFWYWNPVNPKLGVIKDKNIDGIWTYSRFDAKKYGLKYNPQFYYPMEVEKANGAETDLMFLGKEKGRGQMINDLAEIAKAQNLKYDFRVVKRSTIKYSDYLNSLMRSRCVVDLVPEQSCGLTLRPLEALFYEKKLITNYEDIIKYPFYNKENVFIIGKDDPDNLVNFVNSPYKRIDSKVKDYYNYKGWLERIKNDKSVVI